jgi:GT2 family glycosyltransferase
MRRDISLIIVSYNTRALTLECLRSVFANVHDIEFEITVIDNASTDGSAESIQQDFPQVRLVKSTRNLGFGNACNLAAAEASGEFLLFLNPDTVVLGDSIQKLHAFAKRTLEAGIWGGRMIFADGRLNMISCWSKPTVWRQFCRTFGLAGLFPNSPVFNSEVYGGWNRDTVRPVDIVSGGFLLIRKDLWDKLQGFEARLFMYGDDADLCLRAQALGCRPLMNPEATIIHHSGASETFHGKKLINVLSAQLFVLRRHWNPVQRLVGIPLFVLLPYTRFLGSWVLLHVFGRAGYGELHRAWGTAWRYRNVWLNGEFIQKVPGSD